MLRNRNDLQAFENNVVECQIKKNSKFNVKSKFYFIDLSDDCLHYEDPLLENGESNVKPLVVPKSLRRHFLYAHHNAPLNGGHRGRDATLAALRSRYHWPGMVRDTSRWVKKCVDCAKRKTPQPHQGLMHIRLYQKPWETIGIDLIGLFPETRVTKYKYVMTVVDFFTLYIPCGSPHPKQVSSKRCHSAIYSRSWRTRLSFEAYE